MLMGFLSRSYLLDGGRKKQKEVDRDSANISLEFLLVRKEQLWAEPTGLHWYPQDFGPEHSCF